MTFRKPVLSLSKRHASKKKIMLISHIESSAPYRVERPTNSEAEKDGKLEPTILAAFRGYPQSFQAMNDSFHTIFN
jgi:hypothetical protein